MQRVAITGIGVVSACGVGLTAFAGQVLRGATAIRPVTGYAPGTFRFSSAAQVGPEFDPAEHFGDKQASALDRAAQFAVVAAREAVADANVAVAGVRTAVVCGCSVGGQGSMDDAFLDLYKKGLPRVNPLMIPRVMANAGASQISMEFGVRGPVYTVSTACASANHAIGQAFWMVRSGQVDCALAGGAEAVFSFALLKAWEAMRVVSPDTCRPFSKDRKGMILGEGAAMLVLEPLERAEARGAAIYGELAGFGMSSDAHHITQPSTEGPALAMRAALHDAALPPEAIGYINAHGTGTAANDATETRAIREALGTAAERVAVSSTKAVHGHALGAAGALEAAATLLALRHGVLPPTANFTEPDPECDLDVVANLPRTHTVEHALSNSFAFGGLNAVLAFTAPGVRITS